MRGGRREGAGRKPSTETKQVRIPITMAGAIRELGEFCLKTAQEKLEETRWYQTCPDKSQIELAFKGIEIREWGSMLGGAVQVPVLVVEATDGIEAEEILLRLDKMS